MSIENGGRFMRLLRDNPVLREQVSAGGSQGFERVSAEAGASCRAYDVVAALLREMDTEPGKTGGGH
jgi:hypothetical protein